MLSRVLTVMVLGVLAACAQTAPVAVDLAVLADQQEAWHGRLVEVSGVVETYPDPRHYWVEDEAVNRVELWPPEGWSDLVGQTVTVRGRFTFVEGEGRRIHVEEVRTQDTGGT